MVPLLVMCSRQLIGSHSALRLAELEQTTVGLHQVNPFITKELFLSGPWRYMVWPSDSLSKWVFPGGSLDEVFAFTNWASELV